MTHHRQAAFEAVFGRVSERLKAVFQTSSPVIIFAGSGTSALEAAIVNTLSAEDEAIFVNAGKFGQRWGAIGKAFGVRMHEITVEWGEAVAPQQVDDALKAHPNAKAVFTTLNETSTTVLTDIRSLASVTSQRDALLVVDAVSGLGADELRMDDWGVDLVVSGSQKALMLPPGLAFSAIGPRVQEAMQRSTLPKFYLSYAKALKSLADNTTPFTPVVPTVLALDKALDMVLEDGMEALWDHHRRLAEAVRAGVVGMGMKVFAQRPSNAATAIALPEGINGSALHKKLRDEYQVTCAGGQDHLKGRIERIAHMGYYDQFDMLVVLGAVELALSELGAPVRVGEGVGAAQRYFAGE